MSSSPGTAARRSAMQGKALEIASQLLLVLVLPRLLGPAEFGRLATGLAVMTLGSVAISLGAPSAFARFLPAAPLARRAGLARTMTMWLLRARAAQLVVAAVLGAALAALLPARFPAEDVALVLLAMALDAAAVLFAQVDLGLGQARIWSFRMVVQNSALLLSVPVLYRLLGPAGVLPGLVVATLAGFAFAASRGLGVVRGAERDVPVPDGVVRYGALAGVSGLVGQLTQRGPVLATALLARSPVETGFAALAGNIAMALVRVVRELFTVSLPELVEHWERDPARAERALHGLAWRVEAVLVPVALVGVPLLSRGLPIVAGAAFAPATAALVPVLMLLPLLPVPVLGWQAAALRLEPGLGLAIEAAGLVAFTVTAALLVPLWGALGASAGLFAAVAVGSVLTVWKLPASVTPGLLAVAAAGTLAVLTLALVLGAGR